MKGLAKKFSSQQTKFCCQHNLFSSHTSVFKLFHRYSKNDCGHVVAPYRISGGKQTITLSPLVGKLTWGGDKISEKHDWQFLGEVHTDGCTGKSLCIKCPCLNTGERWTLAAIQWFRYSITYWSYGDGIKASVYTINMLHNLLCNTCVKNHVSKTEPKKVCLSELYYFYLKGINRCVYI